MGSDEDTHTGSRRFRGRLLGFFLQQKPEGNHPQEQEKDGENESDEHGEQES